MIQKQFIISGSKTLSERATTPCVSDLARVVDVKQMGVVGQFSEWEIYSSL